MTPLAQIKHGILNSDWSSVIAGYRSLTGEEVSPPKVSIAMEGSAEKLKAAVIEHIAKTSTDDFNHILQIAMGLSQLSAVIERPLPVVTTPLPEPMATELHVQEVLTKQDGVDLEKYDQPVADSELVVAEEVQTKDGVVKIISAPSSRTTKEANARRVAAKPVADRPPAIRPTIACTGCGKPVKVAIMPPKDVGVKCSTCIRRGVDSIDTGGDDE